MRSSGPTNASAVEQRLADEGEVAKLATRIHAGEHAAEDELVLRYRHGLVLLVLRWTGDPALAEDLAHEALLAVIERLRQRPLDDPGKLGAFLHGTAQNMVLAQQRRTARRRTTTAGDRIDAFEDPGADPFDAAIRTEETLLVRRMIEEMSVARDRELLRRHYILGEPKARICAELGLDAVHFNRVLHRARLRLRALWLGSGFGAVR